MADEYKRINLLIGTQAALATGQEEGMPGIVSDSDYRLGVYAFGAWRLMALRGGSETFSALSISGLSDGYIPRATTAGGLLGNSSLSEDATSVKSAKPLTINGAVRPAWDSGLSTLGMTDESSLLAMHGPAGSSQSLALNAVYSGGAYRVIRSYLPGTSQPRLFQFSTDGSIKYYVDNTTAPLAGATAALTQKFEVNRFGGMGLFGLTAPTSRPTISGQRTATATLAALYQALGATGLILDATTGSSVTREAIIQPLPITNSAPGTVTVVSGGMKSFGFDGNASTEELFYHCDVQHDYIAGGDMVFHVHWMPATATGGNVKWQIEYQWVEGGATWPAPTTLTGTNAAGATAWADKRTDITIQGAGHTYNSRLMVRLFRVPTDAADTYAGDAVLSSVGIHYQADPGQP